MQSWAGSDAQREHAVGASDLIIGIGSPLGDDAVGWRLVERLAVQLPGDTRAIAIGQPMQLLAILPDCRRAWIVDACQGGGSAGTIRRFHWPDLPSLGESASQRSTHGLGLVETLQLAESLGRLPASVIIYAIEIRGATLPSDHVSAAVAASLPLLEKRLMAEVRQPHAAGAIPPAIEVAF